MRGSPIMRTVRSARTGSGSRDCIANKPISADGSTGRTSPVRRVRLRAVQASGRERSSSARTSR